MPYARIRGNQIVIAHGFRDPQTRKVKQQILFTIYSKAEALRVLGERSNGSNCYFQGLLEDQYPGIKFDWPKIQAAIRGQMEVLPDLYQYKTERIQKDFRKEMAAFARQLILTDPQALQSAAHLIRENRHELNFLSDLIRSRLAHDDRAAHEFNQDDPFFWRIRLRGHGVPPETEEWAADVYENGRHDSAEAIFGLLIEGFPDYAEGYNYLGLIALERGELEKALARFEQTMKTGEKLFPKGLAIKHYWDDLATRPFIRGLKNAIFVLNRLARYDEALRLCHRLENQCGDYIDAGVWRATIHLNMGAWQQAVEEAVSSCKLYPTEAFTAAFAFFENAAKEDALSYFIYGTMHHPDLAALLTKATKAHGNWETSSYKSGDHLSYKANLAAFLGQQSPASMRFFKTAFAHPAIQLYTTELDELWAIEGKERPQAMRRYDALRSITFARRQARHMIEDLV